MTEVEVDKYLTYTRLVHIYRAYRNALLNRKYYGHRLSTYTSMNNAIEYVLAFGTPGVVATLVAVQAAFTTTFFASVTGWIAILAAALLAIVAALKPVLNPAVHVARYAKLYIAYSDIYADLERLVLETNANRKLMHNDWEIFLHIKRRSDCLVPEDDEKPNDKLRKQYSQEVKRLIPVKSLWVPQ